MGQVSFDISVHAENLAIERAGREIVRGVSFSLSPGEVLILRGDNGSGKTTLLRAMAGFSRIADGALTFSRDGQDAGRADLDVRNMHFLGHENGISGKLSVTENLRFAREMLGFGTGPNDREIIAAVGLEKLAREPASRLSAGQKRRLAIGRLLIAPRPVWLLDEPATALDRRGHAVLTEACQQHSEKGGIVVLSAHEGFTLPGARRLVLSAGSDEEAAA